MGLGRSLRGLALGLTLVVAGCSSEPITEAPFVRTAADAASTLSAAAQTLRHVHADPARFTVEYGQGAMINYAELVVSVPDELPQLEGAPDQATVEALAGQVKAAMADLQAPCLLPGCDWQSQVARMEAAKQALLDAAD